jgi:hypothetical protein
LFIPGQVLQHGDEIGHVMSSDTAALRGEQAAQRVVARQTPHALIFLVYLSIFAISSRSNTTMA